MWDVEPSIFADLAPEQVEEALTRFQTVDVERGFRLMEEGEDDPSLVVVLKGKLLVSTGGTQLAQLSPGDLAGEMALFGSGMRTATVDAASDATLLLLDADGYEDLRAISHPVAAAIEDHALQQLNNRLRFTSRRIAELAEGTAVERLIPGAGFFDKVANALGAGGILFPGWVDGAGILASSPLFAGVSREILEEVASHFHPVRARRGQFLCMQGETGNDMFVLGSGLVQVIVAVDGDRVEQLATLEAGEAFGMGALLQPDQQRMASCVAAEKVVALSMGRIRWAEIISRADIVGSVMRVAMIRSLADQLAYANGQLSQLDIRRARKELADPSVSAAFLRNAAAALEAYGDQFTDQAPFAPPYGFGAH